MSQSPSPSLTRAIFPTQKEAYRFDSTDLPVDWEGDGVLHTTSTWFDDERGVNSKLNLERSTGNREESIVRNMYINTSGGYDVRDIFELSVSKVVDESEIPLEIVGDAHTFDLKYISPDGTVLSGTNQQAPFEREFESEKRYGVAWSHRRTGNPWAEGKVRAEETSEGTQLEYTIEGHTLHGDVNLETHLEYVLEDLGISYDRVFSDYVNNIE